MKKRNIGQLPIFLNRNENVTYCWDKVEEVKDVGTHLFIYISNLNAIVIPSNSFRDENIKK
ncbi:MAG: YcxB family protein [Clostridium perfringens]|jgi:hypothetical protein|uniref:YcxB family protein n=1 Tax=Clostridium perfringens TaxID=1502 RepID=UPI0022460675|nr:YcxB family protein [Clostridium perfringens]MCX0368030.1 YcxB family protein [Clostridium perfringens]MDU4605110.1 YcxB family protein [Clostridium perfringens]